MGTEDAEKKCWPLSRDFGELFLRKLSVQEPPLMALWLGLDSVRSRFTFKALTSINMRLSFQMLKRFAELF